MTTSSCRRVLHPELIDLTPVPLQAHAHRSIRNVVPSISGEIVHDRLFLDHRPEADLLNHGSADDALDGLSVGACRARDQNGRPADETPGKHEHGMTDR